MLKKSHAQFLSTFYLRSTRRSIKLVKQKVYNSMLILMSMFGPKDKIHHQVNLSLLLSVLYGFFIEQIQYQFSCHVKPTHENYSAKFVLTNHAKLPLGQTTKSFKEQGVNNTIARMAIESTQVTWGLGKVLDGATAQGHLQKGCSNE